MTLVGRQHDGVARTERGSLRIFILSAGIVSSARTSSTSAHSVATASDGRKKVCRSHSIAARVTKLMRASSRSAKNFGNSYGFMAG
jgi:hypothetical protein